MDFGIQGMEEGGEGFVVLEPILHGYQGRTVTRSFFFGQGICPQLGRLTSLKSRGKEMATHSSILA